MLGNADCNCVVTVQFWVMKIRNCQLCCGDECWEIPIDITALQELKVSIMLGPTLTKSFKYLSETSNGHFDWIRLTLCLVNVV
jgi:hypothetical protein